jgi:hypothetical protein
MLVLNILEHCLPPPLEIVFGLPVLVAMFRGGDCDDVVEIFRCLAISFTISSI